MRGADGEKNEISTMNNGGVDAGLYVSAYSLLTMKYFSFKKIIAILVLLLQLYMLEFLEISTKNVFCDGIAKIAHS